MVLTRRAARASKSILKLPNEILATVVSYASRMELVALCRTSRLMHDIATPLLYHDISLSTVPQAEGLLRTITRLASSVSPPSRHVRRFWITKELELSPSLLEAIIPVLPQFSELQCLELLPVAFTDKLNDVYFPDLSSFACTVEAEGSALLGSFLNRHRTITTLGLSLGDGPIASLGPIFLPNPTAYAGPSSFASSFGTPNHASVILLWYPDDLNVDIPLLQLSKTAALDMIIAISTSEALSISTILRGVATHLPHINIVKIMTPRLSREDDTLEIPSLLERLDSLSTLAVRIDGGNSDEERETVKRWGRVCKSLCRIRLNAGEWKLVQGEWVDPE